MRLALITAVAIHALFVTANSYVENDADLAALEEEQRIERDVDAADAILLEAVATAFLDKRDPEPESHALTSSRTSAKHKTCPESCPAALRAAFSPFASWSLAKDYCKAVADGTCTDEPRFKNIRESLIRDSELFCCCIACPTSKSPASGNATVPHNTTSP
ncbi:hypothetical protein DOTSEDRAFT_79597, partial [Dothistroma septosporum NZE10]